jgi:pimeloyl-ACP methyl ester carboxylesterase
VRRGLVESGLLVSLAQIAAVVAIGVPLLAYLAQDSLIFLPPQPLSEARRATVAAEELFHEARDGTRLHAWHVKGASGAPLVLYFGGNAEDVSWMAGEARRRAPGTGWLLVDYRGYGASGGSPSEKALVADALEWYDLATQKLGARDIFVFGRSLGSGVAVQLAAERRVAGVILVAPYDSMVELGRHHYPLLPVSWLLRHRFESASRAPGIAAPLLCLVAGRDEIIPAERSRQLYDAWAGPKRWVELDGAGHNSTDGSPLFWDHIRRFIAGG